MPAKRVYIAGPMRGRPGHNYAAFDAAAKRWREAGYEVINPAELDRQAGFDGATTPSALAVRRLMARSLPLLATVDILAVLPGWCGSRGAIAEVALAAALDPPAPLYDAETMKPLLGDQP